MDINTLQKDMIAAMKAKDKERKAVISDMYSAAKSWLLTKERETIYRMNW